MDKILEQAKLDITVYFRDRVEDILKEKDQPPKHRKPLSLFLELSFPFVNARVQNKLMERHPQTASATEWLKENPQYPIDAYLLAEATAWTAFVDKNTISSLFPIPEMSEYFFFHDLKWYCNLLVTVTEAIEKQMKIDPDASMPKRLQDWCLVRDKLKRPPSRWLEGTEDGEAELIKIKKSDEIPSKKNARKIPVDAAQENKKRRKIFEKWEACWRAELSSLNSEIMLRQHGSRS